MIVAKRIELDYGHTLPNHYSFCSQIHGHRGFVIAYVEGPTDEKTGTSSEGMVYDFKLLKEVMMNEIHAKLDHGFAVWKEDKEDLNFICKRNNKFLITDKPPTAETLAEWAYYQLKDNLPNEIKLVKLRWYETPSSFAQYIETKQEAKRRELKKIISTNQKL